MRNSRIIVLGVRLVVLLIVLLSAAPALHAANHSGLFLSSQTESSQSENPAGVATRHNRDGALLARLVQRLPPAQTPRQTRVPDIRNRTLREAQALLQRNGLALGQQAQREAADVRPGTVIDQIPQAGSSVDVGTAVNVLVAIQPQSSRVPDLRGRSVDEAAEILAETQLRLGKQDQRETASMRPGTVIDQIPQAGSSVDVGTAVNVLVAIQPQSSRVPDLRGRSVDEAAEILAEAQLRLGRRGEEGVANVRPGTVIGQSPGAGAEVRPGTPVDVVIAVPPAPVPLPTVPDLTGRPVREAAAILSETRFRLGQQTEQETANVRPGIVIGQSPRAGAQAPQRTPVDVVVAVAPPPRDLPVPVPDLIGTEASVVPTILSNHELRPGRQTEREASNARPGTVVRQSPDPGTLVSRGTPVDVVIAMAPPPDVPVPVPDLIGVEAVVVPSILSNHELTRGRQSLWEEPGTPPGTVVSQSPRAGTLVARGTPVDVVVAIPPTPAPPPAPVPPLTVPDLTGRSVPEASEILAGTPLRLGLRRQEETVSAPAGTVMEQSPRAGTRVARGTPVDVVIAVPPARPPAPPPPVPPAVPAETVPDLTGNHVREAAGILAGTPLLMGQQTVEEAADAQPGIVIRQFPSAGTAVPPGTAVDVVVAIPPTPVPPPAPPEGPPVTSGTEPAFVAVIVPDVRRLEAGEAVRTLRLANLIEGDQTLTVSDQEPGTVTEQDPAPRTPVSPGSPVRLVVAGVIVPDLAGLGVQEAQAALAGLQLLQAIQGQSTGTVEVQEPPSGTLVPVGSTVTFSLRSTFPFNPTVVVFVLAAAAVVAYRRWRGRRPDPAKRPSPPLEIRAHRDAGKQHIEKRELILPGTEIRIRSVPDAGKQTIQGAGVVKRADQPRRAP